MRNFFVLYVIAMFIAGCSREAEVPPCVLLPINPTSNHAELNHLALPDQEVNIAITAVFVQDEFAYIEAGGSLIILDVQNPADPKQLGVYQDGTVPFITRDNYAYAYWDEQLHILDISNPNNPTEVSCPKDSHLALESGRFSGNHLYKPNGMEGLRIYDLSALTAPFEVAHYQSYSSPELFWHRSVDKWFPRPIYIPVEPMLALEVVVSGQYAYVGEGRMGIDSLYGGQLAVLNISNPRKPKLVSIYPMPNSGAARKVIIDGSYAFVSSYDPYGAQYTIQLDISNPENLVQVASFPNGNLLAVHNGFVYFHDYERGLVVWDVSNPTSPNFVGIIELPLVFSSRYVGAAVFIADIMFEYNYAYIAMEYGGLHIIDISDPENAQEVSVFETP